MTDLVDLIEPTRLALFLTLQAAFEDDDTTEVVDHVLPGTTPSDTLVLVGSIESQNASGKGDQLEEIGAEVEFLYRGMDRAVLIAKVNRARLAIHDQPIGDLVDGAGLHPPRWDNTQVASRPADGVTYYAVSTFIIDAEPA